MMYTVYSNNTVPTGDLNVVGFDFAIRDLSSCPFIDISITTTGKDVHKDKILYVRLGYNRINTGDYIRYSFQIGERSESNKFRISRLKDILENSFLIGYNIKNILEFLYSSDIIPLNVYDIVISEQMLTLGMKDLSYAVDDIIHRYTYRKPDEDFDRYDPSELIQSVFLAQNELASKNNCLVGLRLENKFIPALAYLEWCGFHLNTDRWRKKIQNDNAKLNELKNKLDDIVRNNEELSSKFISSYSEPSLFDDTSISCEPECTVQWNAQNKVISVFKELGLEKTDHKGRKVLPFDESLLCQNDTARELADTYKEYSKTLLDSTTFGSNYLSAVSSTTGRIHVEYNQLGAITGRLSANSSILGLSEDTGKDCFTAETGKVLVSCDYDTEEPRIQACVWNEPRLLNAISKNIDIYSIYAKLIFPQELKNVAYGDIKQVYPEYRQKAKKLANAIVYGISPYKFAELIGTSKEEAEKKLKQILGAFSGRTSFKKSAINSLKEKGYILINAKTGHRVYWPDWEKWMDEQEKMDDAFWVDYNVYHKGTGDDVFKMVKRHLEESDSWFNQNVINYPIQGSGAILLKRSAARLFNWIIKEGLFNKVKLCAFTHDEITVECEYRLVNDVSFAMREIMSTTAKSFFKEVEFPVSRTISNEWI